MNSPDRVAVFIDGGNIYAAPKAIEFDVDYRKLLTELKSWGRLVCVFYYTVVVMVDPVDA